MCIRDSFSVITADGCFYSFNVVYKNEPAQLSIEMEDWVTGLGHGAVGSRHDQNRAVHLSSAGDHVLHIVGVARAVNMGIVTVRCV